MWFGRILSLLCIFFCHIFISKTYKTIIMKCPYYGIHTKVFFFLSIDLDILHYITMINVVVHKGIFLSFMGSD